MSSSRTARLVGAFALWLAAQPVAHAQPSSARAPEGAPVPATPAPAPVTPPPSPAAAAHAPKVTEQAVRNALISWGCAPQDLLAFGARWLAACGPAGVFVVAEGADQTLLLVERRVAPGAVATLFARDGAVWVETVHREARPLADLSALAAPDAAASALVQAPGSLGAPAPSPAVTASAPDTATSTSSRALGPASEEATSPGLTTPERSDSAMAPSRLGNLLIAEAGVRPFLPLKSQKFALLSEFAVSYRGARPWYVQARILPLGLGVGGPRNVVLFGGSVVAGYDQQYFSVGVGVGAARRGDVVGHKDSNGVYSEGFEQNLRFSVTQAARLGALDGLHLSAQSSFVLLSDHWALAFFELKGQIPINRETWLAPAGGGGRQTGFFYVEMGLRRLLRGDRGSGSLFLRPSVGMAAVDTRTLDSAWHPGPMAGVHLEWRQ